MRWIGVFLLTNLISASLGQGQTPGQLTSAQPKPYSLSLQLSSVDSYVFRGRVLDPEPSVQAQLVLGFGRFSYSLFHHAASNGDEDQFEEYTHGIEYTTLAGNTIQTTGYHYFDYDDFRPPTQELFYRISHQTAWHPTYGLAYDFDTYRGYYIDLSLSRPMQLTRHMVFVFDLATAMSFDLEEKANRQGDVLEYGFFADDGFNHASATGRLIWHFSQRLSLDSSYTYCRAFDSLLEEDPDTGNNHATWQATLTLRLP